MPGFLTMLAYVPIGIIFTGALVGLIRFDRLGSAQKFLLTLLVLAFLAEAVSFYLSRSSSNSYPVFHLYALLEYGLLALIYSRGFKSIGLSKVLMSSVFLMVVYAILNVIFFQPLTVPNTNVTIVSSVIMIVVSVLFFFRVLNEMRYAQIEKSAMFWISIGVLIYFASSLIMFFYLTGIAPAVLGDVEVVIMVNIFFNIIHYLCFNIALWMDPE